MQKRRADGSRYISGRGVLLVVVAGFLVNCQSQPAVRVRPLSLRVEPPTASTQVLALAGLDAAAKAEFDALPAEERQSSVQVWVKEAPLGSPPLLGNVERQGDKLVFKPRFPFQPGLAYRTRVTFGMGLISSVPTIYTTFMIPAPRLNPVVRVEAIYPSSDELPENTLKFYIHFSAPMSRGDAYKHIQLLDAAGNRVPYPFLELGEELWNREMTRFTLFFDPGRIKSGLVPRLESGMALEAGKRYTLVIDPDWKDAENRPLVEAGKKTFRVAPADTTQPSPTRWKITAPKPGTSAELVVTFDESLDRALLERVLTVRTSAGTPVAGKITISDHERRWAFTPARPWQAGPHVLAAQTILEDEAGNSIGRPFEVDLSQRQEPAERPVVEVPFTVAP